MYNKKDYCKQEIEPLVAQLKTLCAKERIPFFFTACVADEEDNSEYYQELLSPGAIGIDIKDSKFERLMNVMRGFRTVPMHQDDSLELEFTSE